MDSHSETSFLMYKMQLTGHLYPINGTAVRIGEKGTIIIIIAVIFVLSLFAKHCSKHFPS